MRSVLPPGRPALPPSPPRGLREASARPWGGLRSAPQGPSRHQGGLSAQASRLTAQPGSACTRGPGLRLPALPGLHAGPGLTELPAAAAHPYFPTRLQTEAPALPPTEQTPLTWGSDVLKSQPRRQAVLLAQEGNW